MRRKKSISGDIELEVLKDAISKATSMTSLMRILGYPIKHVYNVYVKEQIAKSNFEFDFSHFTLVKQLMRRIKKVCPVCQKQFLITSKAPNGREEKTTCSHACSNIFFKKGRIYKTEQDIKNEKYSCVANYVKVCWRHHKKKCIICDEILIVEAHHYNEIHSDNRPENFAPLCPTHHRYWHSRYRYLIKDRVDEYVKNFTDNTSTVDDSLWEREVASSNLACLTRE